MLGCFVNSAQLSGVTQMSSALARNKPRRFPDLWSVLWRCCFLWSIGREKPGETTILYQSTTCPGQTFTWSTGSLVSVNRFSVPKLKELLLSGWTIKKKKQKKHWPHPEQTFPKSLLHTQPSLLVYDNPFRVKALCLPSFNKMPVYSSRGSHVSNHGEAGSEEKSTWEKTHLCPHPFCWSGHEQTACFHCRGNPFHFQLSGCWNLHTLPESGMVTANKTPSPMNWEE